MIAITHKQIHAELVPMFFDHETMVLDMYELNEYMRSFFASCFIPVLQTVACKMNVDIKRQENGDESTDKTTNILHMALVVRSCPNLDITWSLVPRRWAGIPEDDTRMASELIDLIRSNSAWGRGILDFAKVELKFEKRCDSDTGDTWWYVRRRALTLHIILKVESTAAWWEEDSVRDKDTLEISRQLVLWDRAPWNDRVIDRL
jgi:hypothetical protein